MKMKNLEKAIILSLMLSGVGSSSAMALEWGLNNSGTTFDISEASKSYSVHSTTDKPMGIINTNNGILTANDIVLEVRSDSNEAAGFFNDGGSVYTGKIWKLQLLAVQVILWSMVLSIKVQGPTTPQNLLPVI